VFNSAGKCVSCHSGDTFTDANLRLHPAADAVSEPEPGGAPSYASRSATKQYRTAPLKGIWQHAPYFHNGAAPTLEAVVDTYNAKQSLGADSVADCRLGSVPQIPIAVDLGRAMEKQEPASSDGVDAEDNDMALVRRIVEGDRAAFQQLMRLHNSALFRAARSVVRDEADAEDVLQDAYLAALRHIGDFRGESRLATWLTRIVINKALGD
jgi:hypothetical protein